MSTHDELGRLRLVDEAARVWFNSAGMEPEHAEAIAALREAVRATHFLVDFSHPAEPPPSYLDQLPTAPVIQLHRGRTSA